MTSLSQRLKAFLQQPSRDYAHGAPLPYDLSLMTNPLGASPLVRAAVARNGADDLVAYPHHIASLEAKIAAMHGLPAPCIMLTAGLVAALDIIAEAYLEPGRRQVRGELSFPYAGIAARRCGAHDHRVPMNQDLGLAWPAMWQAAAAADVVYVCNPNNPTGLTEDVADIDTLDAHGQLLVIDEAAIEYGGTSMLSTIRRHPNRLVLRTFSKAYGLAGARIAYVAADAHTLAPLRRLRHPFSLTGSALTAARAALDHPHHVQQTCHHVHRMLADLMSTCRDLGLRVLTCGAGLGMADVRPWAPNARSFLDRLHAHGAGAVDCGLISPQYDGAIRIAPGDVAANAGFLRAIAAVMAHENQAVLQVSA